MSTTAILVILLAGLKICRAIDCSWVWVLAPVWIKFAEAFLGALLPRLGLLF